MTSLICLSNCLPVQPQSQRVFFDRLIQIFLTMPLDLESIALLELIETRGSFAAAAKALNKAPTAITYQLRQLEDSLDMLIYDRSGHKARLTPAGLTLLEEGRRLLAESERVRRRVKAIATGWEPELRIVLDAIVPFGYITGLLKQFDELKAPTKVRVFTEVLSGSWEALHSGRADLLFGGERPADHFASSAGLEVQTLGTSQFVFAVAPSHPLAKQTDPLCAEDLAKYRAVAVGDTSRQFKPMSFGLQDGQDVLTVPNLEAKIEAQAAGLGCGWVPLERAKPFISSGLLVTKTVEGNNRNGHLCAAWQRGNKGRALQWWIDQIALMGKDQWRT